MSAVDWVTTKLEESEELKIVGRTPEGFLIIESKEDQTIRVAVLGVQGVIKLEDVEPLFAGTMKPQFILNVPSKTLWSGSAIQHIHAASAAFGSLGDVSRAISSGDVGSYRDKNMGFFINAMEQHLNVSEVTYVYNRVFRADRISGPSLTVAVIDTYNMSAEDVRNAKARFNHFDVLVKSSSHGSITTQATKAATSIGAEALKFGELLGRLNR